MFASDDVVFAWAIGKALLIVIVSFATLGYAAWVYAAWAANWQRKNVAHLEIPKDGVLKHRSSVKAGKVLLIANGTTEEQEGARSILSRTSAEETNVPEPEVKSVAIPSNAPLCPEREKKFLKNVGA